MIGSSENQVPANPVVDKETATNRHGCRGTPGPGRPKGSKNKFTKAAKELYALAFDGLGGVDALIAWAKRHPTEFYKLHARLIPIDTGPATGGEDGHVLRVVFVASSQGAD